jgi:hypothetical protein
MKPEGRAVTGDSSPLTPRHKLFLWLVGSHVVLTCGLSFAYYEVIRTGAISSNVLVFDLVGCVALYLAAGLIAAGRTNVRWVFSASIIALAQAAWIWRWLPGWWLIPAFGAVLAAYGAWTFRDRR